MSGGWVMAGLGDSEEEQLHLVTRALAPIPLSVEDWGQKLDWRGFRRERVEGK